MSELTLYNADCLPAMREMEDNAFDLAIVDPPYGIGSSAKKYNGFEEQLKFKKWNDNIPGREYFDELLRVSCRQIIFGGNYYTEFLPPTKSWMVWDKMFNGNANGFSEFEMAWTNGLKTSGRFIRLRANDGFQNAKLKIHPTQKPEELYKAIFLSEALPGWSILDTHLGSMSIAIACHDMGFDLTGYEIDEDYYKAGIKRVEQYRAQGTLFEPEKSQKVTQLTIE